MSAGNGFLGQGYDSRKTKVRGTRTRAASTPFSIGCDTKYTNRKSSQQTK